MQGFTLKRGYQVYILSTGQPLSVLFVSGYISNFLSFLINFSRKILVTSAATDGINTKGKISSHCSKPRGAVLKIGCKNGT
jgi:hypothetical protein